MVVPSSSLVPDDPSVLLTTAGMQQFKKYYTGELDAKKDFVLPGGKPALGTASVQKSFRTSDIDEVGDERHLTFFEMLGNFSFGGYFKKEAIAWAHEFITKEMDLPISYVTVFQGSDVVPKDEESKEIWRSLGVTDIREEGMDDVFWGPTGTSGPCGPTTEIYCKNGAGQDIEIWNIVFNEFFCTGSREELLKGVAELKALPSKGIDTGMGLERLTMCVQKTETIFETDLFSDIVPEGLPTIMDATMKRIMLDHGRGSVFLVADGVRPSNRDQGYVLRRLLRRMMANFYRTRKGSFSGGDILGLDFLDIENILRGVVKKYRDVYPEFDENIVLSVFREENTRFRRAIQNGIRELKKVDALGAKSAFQLFETYGLTFEIIKDFASDKATSITREDFDKEFVKHQEISRAGQEKKFGGHGLVLDTGELKAGDEEELKKATRLHTTTHLLQQALRDILGPSVKQMGSDVTAERTRFDFSFDRKLTDEEKQRVENIINEKIREDLPVSFKEMEKKDAEKTGALHFFKQKYPEKVRVYYVGKTFQDAYSKEFCGGPHVTHTGEIGEVKVQKEEAVAAGVRRIRVVLK